MGFLSSCLLLLPYITKLHRTCTLKLISFSRCLLAQLAAGVWLWASLAARAPPQPHRSSSRWPVRILHSRPTRLTTTPHAQPHRHQATKEEEERGLCLPAWKDGKCSGKGVGACGLGHDDAAGVRMCVWCLLLLCPPPPPFPLTHTHTYTQPLRLEIKKKLTARSDRIKSVDLHPTEVRARRRGEGRGHVLHVCFAAFDCVSKHSHLCSLIMHHTYIHQHSHGSSLRSTRATSLSGTTRPGYVLLLCMPPSLPPSLLPVHGLSISLQPSLLLYVVSGTAGSPSVPLPPLPPSLPPSVPFFRRWSSPSRSATCPCAAPSSSCASLGLSLRLTICS